MPDLREGLEVDGEAVVRHEPGDVNTQGGFEQALARAAGLETETPEEGTEGEPPPEGEPAAEQTPPAEGTEEVLLAGKYKTAEELERGYRELESLQGRQAQEFGGRIQRLEEELANRGDDRYVPESPPMAPGEIEQLVADRGGDATMQWAIKVEADQPGTIDAVRRVWLATGEPDAIEFNVAYLAEQRVEEAMRGMRPQMREEPTVDPTLQQMALREKYGNLKAELSRSDPDFELYGPHLDAVVADENTPRELQAMMLSGNPDHMREAANYLRQYALVRAYREGGTSPAVKAAANAAAEQREETTRDAKRATAIVSGSQRLSPPAGEQSPEGELTSEDRHRIFKERLFAQDTTDISAGLTVNGQPVQPRPTFPGR